MRVGPEPLHLTYCTNIHAGETWDEIRTNLDRYVLAVKKLVAPDQSFGVGLRLSGQAADVLSRPEELGRFRDWLRQHDLYVFTINGFPYGRFHGTPVKEQVYLPDWLDETRLTYTDRLALILAELLPDEPGLEGSVSTSPGAFKPRVRGAADVTAMATMMLRHAATLHRIRESTGRTISLAIEPEPCCYMETVAETVAFFRDHLFGSDAIGTFERLTGLGRAASEEAIRRHLTVCFDACHMAVEFEDPAAALAALRGAGIAIGKFQISAGIRVASVTPELLERLRPFAEGVYLHQVVERRGGRFTRYVDLPEALAAVELSGAADREWRIHFHVPLFLEQLDAFVNTQAYLRELLAMLRAGSPSRHLEVETYTWDVLPEEYRREDIVSAVARELNWVRDRLVS